MTWRDLFDRADGYDVEIAAIKATRAARRDDDGE